MTVTSSVAYLTGLQNPILLGPIIFGSIFPDYAEKLGTKKRILQHRTVTHSVLFWTVITFLFWLCETYNRDLLIPFFSQDIIKAFLFGIWGHLIEDSLTITGIPIFYNKKRIAFKLFRTGSIFEYCLTWGLFFVVLIKLYFNFNFFQNLEIFPW